MSREFEIITPILVYIQANLHEDLELNEIAKKAGLSPYYFHRMFKQVVGETLKQYVSRIKLEKAAFALRFWDEKLIGISTELGYKNPETFTRAFKRQFHLTPAKYRQQFQMGKMHAEITPALLNQLTGTFEVSPVSIKQLNAIDVAFLRSTGPYEEVDPRQFDQLIAWSKGKGLAPENRLLIGVGHDAPSITPQELLRFDCCIEVDAPFPSEGEISYQRLEGGKFATATYVGPYGIEMQSAYLKLYHSIQSNPNLEFVGVPVLEIYRTTTINPAYRLNQTDIYVPVKMKA